jgi:hypothetical protein
MRKAKVALAGQLAVVLHSMLRDQTNFIPKGARRSWLHNRGRRSPPRKGLRRHLLETSPFAGTMDLVRPQGP